MSSMKLRKYVFLTGNYNKISVVLKRCKKQKKKTSYTNLHGVEIPKKDIGAKLYRCETLFFTLSFVKCIFFLMCFKKIHLDLLEFKI